MVYGCDICQDVCPWNRGIEKRRAERSTREPSRIVSLREWLQDDGDALRERYRRLYVPRNDPRWLRRNALVALGNAGPPADAHLAEPYLEGSDEMLRETAAWALERLAARAGE